MKQYIVDAFAEKLFSGNPAAVVPCKKMPSSEMMQRIAIENNYSETLVATKGLAKEVYYDDGDMVVIVADEQELAQFEPDADLIKKLDGLGLIMTAKSKQYDFVSRCFYPKLDVLEDSVTGRAHTYMTPIWSKKLKKQIMIAKQISKRGGIITVRQQDDKVFLTGKVQLFMQGDIPFDF